ncbi:MAG: sialate O-acetylesterase [Alphaproteobacteria bacterium]
MTWLRILTIYLLLPFIAVAVAAPFIYQEIELERISQRVFHDTRAKSKVDCGKDINTAVILVFGQSNSTNEGEGRYKANSNVLNFNYIDGNCYLAHDPLLGTSGIGGSFLSRLGDSLVARGKFKRVILVPLSVGASYIRDWAPKGNLHERLYVVAENLRQKALSVSHVLFHLGEADAGAGTAPEEYRRQFHAIVTNLRQLKFRAPIYVAIATRCGGPSNEDIRAIQMSVSDPFLGIYPGPDTDKIGMDMRFDGCHMNAAGLDRHAEMWFEAITVRQAE